LTTLRSSDDRASWLRTLVQAISNLLHSNLIMSYEL
jgi:hypothetical protein